MDTRRSYDYAKPTTLVAIIADALDHVNQYTRPATLATARQIIADAWDALVANVGQDEAVEMVEGAGISLDTLEEMAY